MWYNFHCIALRFHPPTVTPIRKIWYNRPCATPHFVMRCDAGHVRYNPIPWYLIHYVPNHDSTHDSGAHALFETSLWLRFFALFNTLDYSPICLRDRPLNHNLNYKNIVQILLVLTHLSLWTTIPPTPARRQKCKRLRGGKLASQI
jgi:hypothetical protein